MPVTDLAAALFVSTAAPESPFGSGAAAPAGDGESTRAGSFASLLENQSIDLKKASEPIDPNEITPAQGGRLSPAAGDGGALPDAHGLELAVAPEDLSGEALAPVPAAFAALSGAALGPAAVELTDNPAPALALWSLAMPDGKDLPQRRQAAGEEPVGDGQDAASTADPALVMLPGPGLPVVVVAPPIPIDRSGTGALMPVSTAGAAREMTASSLVAAGESEGGDAAGGTTPRSAAGENLRNQPPLEDGLILPGSATVRGNEDAPTAASPLPPGQGAGSVPASMGMHAPALAGGPGFPPAAGTAALPQEGGGPDIASMRFAPDAAGGEGTAATRHAASLPAAGLRPLPDGGGPAGDALPEGLAVAAGQTAAARHDAPSPRPGHSPAGVPVPGTGDATQDGERSPVPARAVPVEAAPAGGPVPSALSAGSAAVSSAPTAAGMRRESPPLPSGGGASPGMASGHTAVLAGSTPPAAEALPLPVRQDLPVAPPLTPPTPPRSERARGAEALAGPSLAPAAADSIVVNADAAAAATGASELGRRQVDSTDASTLLQAPAVREAANTTATHGQTSFASPRALDVPAPAAPPGAPLPMLLAAATGTLGSELGEKILWLSGHNLRGAEIQLDPPELGPLQIQVHSHRDGTSVQFTTHTAVARDALESSLPRLRELLEGSGVPLLDVNISQQQRQGQRPQDGALAAPPAMRDRLAAAGQGTPDAPRRRTVGLVDAYA